ncbi:MaoC/PaaZ C-terminal domain-containing protein [Actinoplanes sp. NBRC 101535]|uniref:MaoC family dehydratase n=1 Tax=Actinoplanes sp. NBRC 101535 TaxID=3032196 RepID=UPI0024A36694|nr:MaoC/PaaZ C-terminal domain-containing protein [Actinoplanes sp. NBRC 101535]GLX99875.1 hypothetical protein Acsp01_02550 [Actinoplanes sp. NBRC 101535]
MTTGSSYVRAALGSLPGRARGAALPDGAATRQAVVVDREHLAAYDRVCGFRLGDVLPATYPHVLAFPLAMRLMTTPGFPLPLVGLVHVANRITVRRPVGAASPLDLAVRAVDLRDHPRGRQFDLVVSASVDGVPVWESVSTYLRITRPSPGTTTPPPVADASFPSNAVWRVPAGVGGAYAAVSGDRNPIHTSALGARLFGFPRPIAHGMWTKARALAALEGRLPEAYTVEVAFKQPVPLPARVRFQAAREGDGWRFALTSRRPHLTGSVTVG